MKRSTHAIPISTVNYSNSSQIVALLTREQGLLDAIAKGAHRPKNPFHGPFDLAVLYGVDYLDRRSGSLSILSEAVVLDGFRGLRQEWRRHVAASHVIEFLRGVSVPNEPTPELFDLTCATFSSLSDDPLETLSWTVLHFEVRALRILGFLSTIDGCAVCGKTWPGGAKAAYFSAICGGLVCRGCHRARPPATDRIAALSGKAVGALRELTASPVLPAPQALSARELRQLHMCAARSCSALLERPLRMIRYQRAWL